MNAAPVRLVVPTDFEILEAMSCGQRETAKNVSVMIDRDSRYMNNQLPKLAGAGLVERVGPAEKSGMYKITPKGLAALDHRDEYSHDSADEFGDLISDVADEYTVPSLKDCDGE